MALAGFTGCEVGNKYPKDPDELHKYLDIRGIQICNAWFSTFLTTKPYEEKEAEFIKHITFLKAMGAKVVGDYIRSETVSSSQGKYILSYSLVTGPAFIVFTIGSFLGNTKAAVLVAVAHYTAAFLNKGFYYTTDRVLKSHITLPANVDYMENCSHAIASGFKAMATILAYLMFFTIGINMMEHIGVFGVVGNETVAAVIKGFFEMTLGTNLIGMCNISIKLKTILASVLVSFGGLSVIGQSMSMTRMTGIGFRDIFEIKLTHGLIAGIVATLLVNNVVI
jgi:hypothetical protein